ncbi:hypothetical protein pb186bvf_006115 [Paramecium bursaria]
MNNIYNQWVLINQKIKKQTYQVFLQLIQNQIMKQKLDNQCHQLGPQIQKEDKEKMNLEDLHMHILGIEFMFIIKRRKCHRSINQLLQCEKKYGSFWAAFDCQYENHLMQQCLEHEFEVEMDKMRRNTKMNHEWWWRDLWRSW